MFCESGGNLSSSAIGSQLFTKVLYNFKQHNRRTLMDLIFTWKLYLLKCERRIISLATLCHSVVVLVVGYDL